MKTILIVDDENGITEEVKSYFEEEGYRVLTADTGKEGMRLILEGQPDLLILDVKLPDISGIHILKFVKENCPSVKVIVNTGYVDQNIIDEAEKLGQDCFLAKPFNLEKLCDEVTRLIGNPV